ncbi:hypothetical protein B0O80DRAFT_449635 [Mortierella sp. GBAus27b]|nr:hypothetical protein B0O80DRAFT_449635 [Mortierella sp. GBAus27b]
MDMDEPALSIAAERLMSQQDPQPCLVNTIDRIKSNRLLVKETASGSTHTSSLSCGTILQDCLPSGQERSKDARFSDQMFGITYSLSGSTLDRSTANRNKSSNSNTGGTHDSVHQSSKRRVELSQVPSNVDAVTSHIASLNLCDPILGVTGSIKARSNHCKPIVRATSSRAGHSRQHKRSTRRVTFEADQSTDKDINQASSRLSSLDLNSHTSSNRANNDGNRRTSEPEEARRRKLPGGQVVSETASNKEGDLAAFNSQPASLNLDDNRLLETQIEPRQTKQPRGRGDGIEKASRVTIPSVEPGIHAPEADIDMEGELGLDIRHCREMSRDDLRRARDKIFDELDALWEEVDECGRSLRSYTRCLLRMGVLMEQLMNIYDASTARSASRT